MTAVTLVTTASDVKTRMAAMRAKKAEKAAQGKSVHAGPQNQNAVATVRESGRFARFMADSEWIELAAKKGLRLPDNTIPATPANIEKWLRKLGLTTAWFLEWCDYRRLADWQKHNPTWGMRATVGLWLEDLEP